MKLLVVEDSERLRRALLEGLRRCGFTVDVAADGREGLAFAETVSYDVIVLDLMLPRMDGLTMLRRLRDRGHRARVLILSARDQIEDRVRGLDLGADDYLVKPFAFEEMVARIKALVRRRHEVRSAEIGIRGVTIDTTQRRVRVSEGEVSLTPTEYNLLEYLALRRGHVVSKTQLRDHLYDSESLTESNVIEVLVSNLRRKFREAGADNVIETRRGFGYCVQ